MNPILPIQHFLPDSEPRVWEDGRMYIYGSYDKKEKKEQEVYCSHEYHVFSTDDLVNWEDNGQSFSANDVPWSNDLLFAPDCMYKDGTYY